MGVIVNVLTVLAHACLPSMGSYCASKAAALSMTQGVRAELMPWGVRVAAVFPSTVDTPTSAESPPPKLRPAEVAEAVVTMILNGTEDHYPGRIASDLYAGWRDSHKVVERELGADASRAALGSSNTHETGGGDLCQPGCSSC